MTPPSTIAAASLTFWQQTPTAPAAIWRSAISGHLCDFACGRQPQAARRLGHGRDVALEGVEVDQQRRGVDLGERHSGFGWRREGHWRILNRTIVHRSRIRTTIRVHRRSPAVPPMFRPDLLKGKRILVTGGGTGLGREIGRELPELGADLYICGRREAVLDETAAELVAKHGGR